MDDIKRKLEFDNPTIQLQAINKLLSLIEKGKQNGEAITKSTPKISELDYLWELTDDTSPVIRNGACRALVSLTANGHADLSFILEEIFNRLPVAKCTNGYVLILKHFLLLQNGIQSSAQTSYQQRLMQHPFVLILRSNSSSWPYVLEQLKYVCLQDKERNRNLEAVIPFLEYILWNPNRPQSTACLRWSLLGFLGNMTRNGDELVLQKFLSETSRWLKLDTCSDLQESLEIVKIIAQATAANSSELEYVIVLLATICLQMIRLDIDPCSGLQLLHTLLLQNVNEEKSLSPFIDATAFLVAAMLDNPGATNETNILLVVEALVKSGVVSRLIIAAFISPLLQILSVPVSFTLVADAKSGCQQKASALIREIEKSLNSAKHCVKKRTEVPDTVAIATEIVHPSLSYTVHYAQLAEKMEVAPYLAYDWLDHIAGNLKTLSYEWKFLSHLVVGILLHGLQHRELMRKAVSVIVAIAEADKTQSPTLFPVLVHKLGREVDVDLRLCILHSLPDMATHKIAVGPILQTLHMLSSTPSLQAMSIRLTSKLWQRQDRVFPFLYELLSEPEENVAEGVEFDVLIAKAASIKDVCLERPEQYGAQLLPPISSILARNLKDTTGIPSVLVLDGLITLCKAEVIDLQSTWKILAKKLIKDFRPQVVQKLCELLALAPEIDSNNVEYENFRSEIINYLWKQANTNRHFISVGAAYRALAKFSPEDYRLKNLPEKAKADLKLPANMAATPYEQAKNVEDVLTCIPGSCYTKLLLAVDRKAFPDYGYFLSNQIVDEVTRLPRGSYHSSLRTNKVIQHNKVLAAIPSLIVKKQEYNKVSGLQGSLASGVLLSYEPPVEYGKNGEPLHRSFASQAREYQKKLEVLLEEVPIGASEWQRSLALIQGWLSYMERLYFVSVEGRKAELEMQMKHGTFTGNENDFKKQTSHSWLWVRDRVAECLKTAAKGKPGLQGNAILALGALAAAVAKFTSNMDEDIIKTIGGGDGTTDHMNHDIWMNLVYETVLGVIDASRPSKSRIFTWFQGTEKGSSLSMLVRACAAVSISYFAPNLAVNNSEKARQVIERLMAVLNDSDSPAIQLYAGLGLGMYLTRLYQLHFVDTGGVEARCLLSVSMKNFMQYALSDDMDNKAGSVLGLTLATCAMCLDHDAETRMNASDIQSVIQEKVEGDEYMTIIKEVMCMSLVCITAAACTARILSIEVAETTLRKLEQLTTNYQNNYTVASSLGLMIHWLQRVSYPNAAEMKDHLLKVWLPALASESAPTSSRLAALHGLCSLFGLQNFLLQIPDDVLETDSDVGLNELLHLMTEIVSVSKEIGMQNCCAWMVGQLYIVTTKKGNEGNALPLNYSYLKESSILRAVVDFVTSSCKKECKEWDEEALEVCLQALSTPFNRALPPLNWMKILSPFIHVSTNEKLQFLSIKIALNHANSSIAAASFITTCLSAPTFRYLTIESHCAILEGLSHFVKRIPSNKLQIFLEKEVLSLFQSHQENRVLIFAALHGLKASLSTRGVSSSMLQALYEISEQVYGLITMEDKEMINIYCDCLKSLPHDITEQITTVDNVVSTELEKALYILCRLVSDDTYPLTWLSNIIDVIASSGCTVSLDSLYLCLQRLSTTQADNYAAWILGIMGQTQCVIEWRSTLNIQDVEHMCQAVNSYVDIFATTMVAAASHFLCFSPAFHQNSVTNLKYLPLGLQVALDQEEFQSLCPKVIDWMIGLCENIGVLSEFKQQIFRASLLALKDREEFKKTAVWTNILSLLHS